MYQLPTLEGIVIIEKKVGLPSLTIQFPVFQIMKGVREYCRAARMCGGVRMWTNKAVKQFNSKSYKIKLLRLGWQRQNLSNFP